MMRALKFLPNLMTLGNLAAGMLGIICAAREEMIWSVVFMGIALVLDFFDGFVARLVHAQSDLGRELDSLADVVTFGALPGFMLFQLITASRGMYFTQWHSWTFLDVAAASVALLVPMAAAYRLARFNLSQSSSAHFSGLPVPAAAMVVAGLPLVLEMNYFLNPYVAMPAYLMPVLVEAQRLDPADIALIKALQSTLTYQLISVLLAWMMVSKWPMLSLKFKGWRWKKNKWSYAILIWALVAYLIFLLPYLPFGPRIPLTIDYLILPIFMAGYFLLSLIYTTFGRAKSEQHVHEIQS